MAARFRAAVPASFEILGEFPNIGTIRREHDPELREVRSIHVRGFESMLLFYRVTPTSIDIVRIMHGSRNLDVQRFDA